MNSKITKIKYNPYVSYKRSYKNNDEIRIAIKQTDVYLFLHENFLFIEEKMEDYPLVIS